MNLFSPFGSIKGQSNILMQT